MQVHSKTQVVEVGRDKGEVINRCAIFSPSNPSSNTEEYGHGFRVGCALTFASEAKFEIEAKISFRLEAKKA
jgi:hypothetical protein